jgi:RNA polymerase sigma-70 factor, ECF subfamily
MFTQPSQRGTTQPVVPTVMRTAGAEPGDNHSFYRAPDTAHSAAPRTDDDIGDVLEESRSGNVEAFNRLVEHFQQRVYALCYRMVGEADAADTTQEVFLSAYCGIRTFRGGSFQAWLLRIARNKCYDHLRTRKRRPSVSIDAHDDAYATPIHIVDLGATPDEHWLRAELAHELQRTLHNLGPDQRLVVVLCDVEGYSYDEVVAATGWALGTVKSRLSRGRARLRDALRDFFAWSERPPPDVTRKDITSYRGELRETGSSAASANGI